MRGKIKINNNDLFNEKCQKLIFEDIKENYFNKNFGSLSKTDFELIIFKNYILACKESKLPTSDYELSKKLGIKQSKVRSLKQLKYKKFDSSDENWWINELNDNLNNAHFDSLNRTIKFIVEDINVKEELIHYIEINGWYDDTSLNKKLITLPLECYVNLLINDDFKSKFLEKDIKKFTKICNDSNLEESDKNKLIEFSKNFTKDAMSDILKTGSKEVIKMLLQMLPFGGVASQIVDVLINIISKS